MDDQKEVGGGGQGERKEKKMKGKTTTHPTSISFWATLHIPSLAVDVQAL